LAAALWAARYRRRVVLVDGGRHRNGRANATHGYLGHEGVAPAELLDQARGGVSAYPEIQVKRAVNVDTVTHAASGGFDLRLDDGSHVHSLRLVLATGVRDVFPEIEHFDSFFGTSIFTCPSCDGYEAQGRTVAVLGDDDDLAALAIGLLDWAKSVTVIRASTGNGTQDRALAESGIKVVEGEPVTFVGEDGQVRAVRLADGETVECDMVFCTVGQVQHSDLPAQLGCTISSEGCVIVDDHCRTSIEHVFAAGDMTPGPHLVQVAASKGAIAGIAAATSLRGERGAPSSPLPAPDADRVLEAHRSRTQSR
jgi:thioredoxin reductase